MIISDTTEYYLKSYNGAYLWNHLPEDLRKANFPDDFKKEIHGLVLISTLILFL